MPTTDRVSPLDVAAESSDGALRARWQSHRGLLSISARRQGPGPGEEEEDPWVMVHERETRCAVRMLAVSGPLPNSPGNNHDQGGKERYAVCAATSAGALVLFFFNRILKKEVGGSTVNSWTASDNPIAQNGFLHPTTPVACACFSSKGDLALGLYCGRVAVWSLSTPWSSTKDEGCEKVATLSTGGSERVRGLVFHPSGFVIACVDWLGFVSVFSRPRDGAGGQEGWSSGWERVARLQATDLFAERDLSAEVRWRARGNVFEVRGTGPARAALFHCEGRWVEEVEEGECGAVARNEGGVWFSGAGCEVVCSQDRDHGLDPVAYDHSRDNLPAELEVWRLAKQGPPSSSMAIGDGPMARCALEFLPPRWCLSVCPFPGDGLCEGDGPAVAVAACEERREVLVRHGGVEYAWGFDGGEWRAAAIPKTVRSE